MSIPNLGLDAEQAEALFNLANNGVLTRIDQRSERAGELFQWGLHPRTAEPGAHSPSTTTPSPRRIH